MKAAFALLIVSSLAPIAGDVAGQAPRPTAEIRRTATVSFGRVSTESADGKDANKRLEALKQKMAADLMTKQKELNADSAKTAEQRSAEMQRLLAQSQTDFANAQRQLSNELRGKMAPIFEQLAAQHGLDVVLNADTAVLWTAPKLDITNEVLAKMAPPAAK